jgi:F-type H+-transporting ATPase subunit a
MAGAALEYAWDLPLTRVNQALGASLAENVKEALSSMEHFDAHLEHLLGDLQGYPMWDFGWGSVTPFSLYAVIAAVVVFALVWLLRSNISFIPRLGPSTVVEALVDLVKNEIITPLFGSHGEQYLPYLLTVFLYILVGNILGLIPGGKSPTGTMSVTVVLSCSSFLFFNYAGVKHSGFWHYILGLAPSGTPPVVNVMVILIELFSMSMRIVSLAIRLFANVFAGHLVMGCFALLTSMFFQDFLTNITANFMQGGISFVLLIILTTVYISEFLVAFIQAYVFTLLSGVYISLAVSSH